MESPTSKTSTSTAIKIEDDDDYDAATYITRRKRTTLPKKGSPFERRNIKVPGLNYSTATKKGKKIVKC
jgi:cytochrome c